MASVSTMVAPKETAAPETRSVPSDADLRGMTQDERARALGMMTEQLTGKSLYIEFDPEATERFAYPWAPDVDFNRRTEIDTDKMTTTEVNARIRELMREGYGTIVLRNPRGKHSVGVGILSRLNLVIEGSCGYFAIGLIDGPNVRVIGRVGWSCGENMMSGTVVIEKNAGSTFGAAIRGGDLVCKGSVGSRTGIDQKGGTIIVGGDTGALSGFMMQRGRMVVCGNAGKNLGDSMYDGTIYVGGEIQSLGVDAVEAELTDLDRKWLTRKLSQYELMPEKGVDHFTKIVAGKQLWNYDNLEPNEKKLIL
ncbi:GXGXG motif-containing protein [Nitratireductor sp. GCM10026969]|uniref:GltB/FmdC/FwdC-like GXGXG domain-containing protein n=1 Tax=Nitratireductor sp. GCM10026969 TaxID=3252645 RepID=UPI00361CEF00